METIENKQDATPEISQDFRSTAELGERFEDTSTSSEVPQSTEVRSWEEQMALDEAETDAKNSLKPLDTDEDKYESQLDGFTVVDNTRNDVDELPDELKDELGDPDDEAKL